MGELPAVIEHRREERLQDDGKVALSYWWDIEIPQMFADSISGEDVIHCIDQAALQIALSVKELQEYGPRLPHSPDPFDLQVALSDLIRFDYDLDELLGEA
jgi:hypothetical protein